MAVVNVPQIVRVGGGDPGPVEVFEPMTQYLSIHHTSGNPALLVNPAANGVGAQTSRLPWDWHFHFFSSSDAATDQSMIEDILAVGRRCRITLGDAEFDNGGTSSPTLKLDMAAMFNGLSEAARSVIDAIEIEAFSVGAVDDAGRLKYYNAIQSCVAALTIDYKDRISAYLYNPAPSVGNLRRRHYSLTDYHDLYGQADIGLKRRKHGHQLTGLASAVAWIYGIGTDVEPGSKHTNLWMLVGGQDFGGASPDNWDVTYRPYPAPHLSDHLRQLFVAHYVGVQSISWFTAQRGRFTNYFVDNDTQLPTLTYLIDEGTKWDALVTAIRAYHAGKAVAMIPSNHGSFPLATIFSAINEADPGGEPSTTIWDWGLGDISAATWDTFVGTMPTDGGTGRKKPDSNNYTLALLGANQKINVTINHEVPDVDGTGKLVCHVPQDAFNSHMMVRVWNNSGVFNSNYYTQPHTRYRMAFSANFHTSSQWTTNIEWCIFWQVWGATYPGAWGTGGKHPINPPMALMTTVDNRFRLQIYGENETNLALLDNNLTWTHEVREEWEFSTGLHTFEIVWESDWRLPQSGGTAYCRVKMDDVLRYESAGIVNAFRSLASGIEATGLINVGAYSGARLASPNYPHITFHDLLLEELP